MLLAVACLWVASAGCTADALVLGHNNEPIRAPAGLRRCVVDGDGRAVECWVARSPGHDGREAEGFVLFFVGKADRAERWTEAVAEAWAGRPVEVWGMNYPGSGGSAGPARMDAVVPAAVAAYDAVAREARGRPVFVHASSFGTAAALGLAARRPVAGLVLQNPPPLRDLILGHYGWWNLWLVAGPTASRVPASLDSRANAARVTAPAVFVLHGRDEVIPAKYQRRAVSAYAGPKRVIEMPHARHADALSAEASARLAEGIEWLWQCAEGADRRGPQPL